MNEHRLATAFPMMEPSELRMLANDIKQHGLREPITLLNGEVLDGRHRLRACEMAGVAPRFEELPEGVDPVGFVLSKNVARRHLNASQRAVIAVVLTGFGVGRPRQTAQIQAVSQSDAARALGVGRTSVQQAAQVVKEAIPEVVSAVQAGKLRLHRAAEIAELPREEQQSKLAEATDADRQRTARSSSGVSPVPTEVEESTLSAPPLFKTFATRIAETFGNDVACALKHETPSIPSWTSQEREEAITQLTKLRDQINELLAAITGSQS